MARRRRGLADLFAGRATAERAEMIGILRFLALAAYLLLYVLVSFIPVGFDWQSPFWTEIFCRRSGCRGPGRFCM